MSHGQYKQLFEESQFIDGRGSSGNTYPTARFVNFITIFVNLSKEYGTAMKENITEKMRSEAEKCDYLMEFALSHSLEGGTGSAISSIIAEELGLTFLVLL